MVALVVLDPLEADAMRRLVHGAHHPQLLRAGERADPRPQLDPPRRATVVGRRAPRRGARGASTPGSGRASPPARRRRSAEAPSMNSVDGRLHQRLRSVPRNARASNGLRADSTPSRSSCVVERRAATGSPGWRQGRRSADGSPVTSATVRDSSSSATAPPARRARVARRRSASAAAPAPPRPTASPRRPSCGGDAGAAGPAPAASSAVGRNRRGSASRRSSSVQPRGTTIASAWRLQSEPARSGIAHPGRAAPTTRGGGRRRTRRPSPRHPSTRGARTACPSPTKIAV